MLRNKFPKSVSFNLKNATDQAILKHVKKRNFSGYVKKLILADMARKEDLKPLSKFEQLQQELHRRTDDISGNPQRNPDTKSDY